MNDVKFDKSNSSTKEVKESKVQDLDDNEMQELQKMYNQSFTSVKEGELVEGKVSEITARDVMIDIGYKSEGNIPLEEFDNVDSLKIGDSVKVFLETKEDDDGMVVVSKRRADRYLGWKYIEDNHQEGDIIEGKVIRKVRGGLIVSIGIDAFLPGSLASIKGPADMDEMLGNTYKFKIVKITPSRKNIVLSRRAVVEEELRKKSEKLLDELEEDQTRRGRVKNITDFGAFIDLGGVDGLLHITDMSWGRVNHPSEILALNDEIEVVILNVDKENRKVSLGLKQKTESPWEDAENKYSVGTKIKGKVVNIVPYGAFIELEKGVEGLVHISEMSWVRKVKHPGELLAMGDVIEAIVLNLDTERQRISLGLKQLEPNPWEGVEDRYNEGDTVVGKVHHITDYGAFVELEDGVDGLIHVSDLSWTKKVKDAKDMLKKGQTVKAKVLFVDAENQRISLGLKQMEEDPWPELVEKYSPGTKCEGKIVKVTDFGLFVELEEDLEGLLHKSEAKIPETEDIDFKSGQKVEVSVIKVDKNKHQIRLKLESIEQETEDNSGKKVDQKDKKETPDKETDSEEETEDEVDISEENKDNDSKEVDRDNIEETPEVDKPEEESVKETDSEEETEDEVDISEESVNDDEKEIDKEIEEDKKTESE